jgi:hypothetical protein
MQTAKQKSERGKKRDGWVEENSRGMKMKVKRGKEYSCSLYLVSYESKVLKLKVTAF